MNDKPRGRPPYPLHKIIAAITRADVNGVVAALADTGFAHDRIEVITAEDVPGLDEPIGGSGVHGFLTRLSLSLGDDLDEFEQARQELLYGHALILVLVFGSAEHDCAHAVLRQHGGHAIHYFGDWTITTLAGDDH